MCFMLHIIIYYDGNNAGPTKPLIHLQTIYGSSNEKICRSLTPFL